MDKLRNLMVFSLSPGEIKEIALEHIDKIEHGELEFIIDYVEMHRDQIIEAIEESIYSIIENYTWRVRDDFLSDLKDCLNTDDPYDAWKAKIASEAK